MNINKVKFKKSDSIVQCPKCGNKTEFLLKSELFIKSKEPQKECDIYQTWLTCKCGFEHDEKYRYKDICRDYETLIAAEFCWRDAISQ